MGKKKKSQNKMLKSTAKTTSVLDELKFIKKNRKP